MACTYVESGLGCQSPQFRIVSFGPHQTRSGRLTESYAEFYPGNGADQNLIEILNCFYEMGLPHDYIGFLRHRQLIDSEIHIILLLFLFLLKVARQAPVEQTNVTT